jgi:hypothetical protein
MTRIVVTEYVSVGDVVEAPSGTETFERIGWTDAFTRGPEADRFRLDEASASDARCCSVGSRTTSSPPSGHITRANSPTS